MNLIQMDVLDSINRFMQLPVFPDGEHKLTLAMALHLLLFIGVLLWMTGVLRRWLIDRILSKFSKFDVGLRHALGSISSYAFLCIGLLVVLDTAGIDITIITVLIGALGLGISLSLQNIMTNFMSGLIILFERPVKVGDRVEVANVVGEVVDISLRSATILTSDNIAIIVPNSEFISSKVINWSYNEKIVRFRLPISISSDADPEVFTRALLQIAREQPEILKDPAPEVLFQSFGNHTQNFLLLVWSHDASHPDQLQSRLNYAISKLLRELSIGLPVGEGKLDEVVHFEPAALTEIAR